VVWIILGLLLGGLPAATGHAQDDEDRVAATVDDIPLYAGEVEWIVERAAKQTELDVAARDQLRAAALDQLVRQQSALSELERQNEACTRQELELALTRFSEELKRQGKTLEDVYRERRIPKAAFERGMRWRMSWNAYLTKTLTEEHLQRYYESHRRDFDGTRLRVAQILLTLPTDIADESPARKQLEDIRRKIEGGSLTFGDAARQYSEAPSAASGGEMGWISRHEPMPDTFSSAAYLLAKGEVSPPVRSPLGMHLIQCLEIEAGTRTWQEARDELATAAQRDLFDQLVESAWKKSRVEFADGQPHFRTGTKVLEQSTPGMESKGSAGK
jgi:parvulin-like peptidyl-prolyl isomerase